MEAMCLNWKSLSHYNFFRINHKQQSQTKSETKKLFAKSSFSNITTNKTSLLRIYFHLLIQSLFLHCSKVKVLAQSCLILCEPMDCSPPGSSIHGILQARILEQVAISFSKGEGDFFFFINLVSIQLFKKSICIYISRIIFKCLSISKHLNVNQIPLFCMVVF